ncbi:MAG: ORF6N domain-containing protein [Fibrobacter sp.]|nr:ORF6N domain-containing protein [Fibrobacter sp.]
MDESVKKLTVMDVKSRIVAIRDKNVLLDKDVAELYGVTTKEVNQAIKNNKAKFPMGYCFDLCKSEKNELVKNFDRFEKLKHSTVNPTAFTEKGLYMLATILKSKRAVETTIAIIDTFVQIRDLCSTIEHIQEAVDGGQEQKVLLNKSGRILANVIGENLSSKTTKTEIELNFAIVKIKHTIERA